MKNCALTIISVAGFVGSSLFGQDQANMSVVAKLIQARVTTSRSPAVASQNALEWDRSILSRNGLIQPELARVSTGHRFLGAGIDFIARKYSSPVSLETRQTEQYWLLRVSRKDMLNQSAVDWTHQLLGLAADSWKTESAPKEWKVSRYAPASVKLDLSSGAHAQAYQRYLWERTLHVIETDFFIIVYVEKVFPTRPKVIGTGLDLNLDWFTDSENPHNLRGEKIRNKWWQFWRW